MMKTKFFALLTFLMLSISTQGIAAEKQASVRIESDENMTLLSKVPANEIPYLVQLTWTSNDANVFCQWQAEKPSSMAIIQTLHFHPKKREIAVMPCNNSGPTLLQQAVEVDSPTLGVYLVLNTYSKLLIQSEIAEWAEQNDYSNSPIILTMNHKTGQAFLPYLE